VLKRAGLLPETQERLLRRYGGLAAEVIASAPDACDSVDGYLRGELAYAVTHEGARRVEDVFARRTRIAIETRDGGLAAAPLVAELLRRELGWPAERASDEVAAYRAWIAAERAGQPGSGLCQPAGTGVTLFT
jgi:glycerol-3-phosphate dehydrogenase